MNEMISVIIPVYNVERYLQECIESVINQTYRNLEIILIDDESPDQCGKICDNYAEKDRRIKVIHKKNGGAASARNEGLKIAKGEYLSFVDSDDYLAVDAYEKALEALKRNCADMVQFGFSSVFKTYSDDVIVIPMESVYDTETYLKRYTSDWTCGLACDKLFKRQLFDGIFYETGHRIDDEFFTYQGVMNAKKIAYIPEVLYFYRQRRSSAMNTPKVGEQILLDRLDYLKKRKGKISERYPQLSNWFEVNYAESLLFLTKNSFVSQEVIRRIKVEMWLSLTQSAPVRSNYKLCYGIVRRLCTPKWKIVKEERDKQLAHDVKEYYE